ncbi:hypothetical protein Tco_0976800 [Tanacetum coccineum]|uniref:Uncharacterized protein n=1 Tax=Tanacetum coccineum TaxID=301880 RepID=A0ABQ5EIC7_9ASTR
MQENQDPKDGLAIKWNYKNLTELLERKSDEFVLNHEGDKNNSGDLFEEYLTIKSRIKWSDIGSLISPLSLALSTFVFTSRDLFNSLSSRLLSALPPWFFSLCIDQHAHTLHLLESSLIISPEAWFLRRFRSCKPILVNGEFNADNTNAQVTFQRVLFDVGLKQVFSSFHGDDILKYHSDVLAKSQG